MSCPVFALAKSTNDARKANLPSYTKLIQLPFLASFAALILSCRGPALSRTMPSGQPKIFGHLLELLSACFSVGLAMSSRILLEILRLNFSYLKPRNGFQKADIQLISFRYGILDGRCPHAKAIGRGYSC